MFTAAKVDLIASGVGFWCIAIENVCFAKTDLIHFWTKLDGCFMKN